MKRKTVEKINATGSVKTSKGRVKTSKGSVKASKGRVKISKGSLKASKTSVKASKKTIKTSKAIVKIPKIIVKKSKVKKSGIQIKPMEPAQMLHSIFQGFSIPAFVIGANHKVLYWNRALEKLTNIPMSAVLDTNQHWRAFYADERPCMADLLVDGAENRIPQWYAGKYKKSDLLEEAYEATDFFPDLGKKGRWQRFTAAVIRQADGNIIGAITTLEDITEKMTAELLLREGEQQLYNIIHGSPIPAYVIGLDHNVIYWNRALEKLSKIPAKDIVGTNQHWRAFYATERPCMADLVVDQTMETIPEWYGGVTKSKLLEDTYEAEGFFPDLGDKGRWLRFTVSPLRSSRGAIVGCIETLEDITEREMTERIVFESERILHSVLEGFSIPAFVIDKNHKILYWNRALEKLTGVKADDVRGTNQQWRVFYKKERPCMADLLVDSALENVPKWYSGKYQKSDLIEDAYEATDFFPELGDSGRWLRFTAALIRDVQGELIGAVETLENITEQKLAQDALKQKDKKE
jgi:PAS domain S-box-containing protein